MQHIDYKVEGGKLLRIDVELEKNVIKNVEMKGDFFIYPEEGVKKIERKLEGIKVEEADKKVRKAIKSNDLEVIGFSPEDLATALQRLIA